METLLGVKHQTIVEPRYCLHGSYAYPIRGK
jgi:hypothetical protein